MGLISEKKRQIQGSRIWKSRIWNEGVKCDGLDSPTAKRYDHSSRYFRRINIYIYMSELRLVYSICEWHRSKLHACISSAFVSWILLFLLFFIIQHGLSHREGIKYIKGDKRIYIAEVMQILYRVTSPRINFRSLENLAGNLIFNRATNRCLVPI